MRIKREISTALQSMLSKYPVIALTGPRQSGKTTLLKSIFPDFQYVSLENPDNRDFAQLDPNGFLEKYSSKVIIDEVQRVPPLFSYIQSWVDDSGLMGQYILSGSQNFHLMHNITQSLAGRVAIFKLFPFDLQELKSAVLLKEEYSENLLNGFYPAIYDRDIPPRIFYSNYIQTYIQKDISELISIKNTKQFQNFLSLCATHAGQLLNMNAIANQCGISQPTAKSWITVLENSYIVFTLQPLYKNFSKRVIKTPKLYFYDTGLLCHLLKIKIPDQILTHPLKGHLFENMMVAEYLKRMYHKNALEDVWFWRDSAGHEVDFIVEDGLSMDLFEIKSTKTIMSGLFKGLNYFDQYYNKDKIRKSLVYTGSEHQKRSTVEIIPWADFGK
ncbi:MAG: ATP-binding protein [Bacteroidota bacterium]|nr:ATP-binding protein [Bacteroidota bacterium]